MTQNVILWTYNLQIRSKNAAGTVLHTWQATNDPTTGTINQPIRCGPPTYEPEVVGERVALNRFRDIVYDGVRKRLKIAFESSVPYIRGLTGSGTITQYLHIVLSDILTLGNYLELSIDGGTTWRAVTLETTIDYHAVSDHNVRLGVELEFLTMAVYPAVPGVAGADW